MEIILKKDFICGLPVIMFPVSKFENRKVVMFEGEQKSYSINDKLTMNTLSYNYKKNCIIVDLNKKSEGLFYGVLVENEVVKEYKEILEEDFAKVEAVYLPTGEELILEYFEDFAQYILQEKRFENIVDELKGEYNSLMINMQEKSETDDMYFILNKHKLDDNLKEQIDMSKLFEESWYGKPKKEITIFGLYLSCLVSEMLSNLQQLDTLNNSVTKKRVEEIITDSISNGEKRLGVIKDSFSNFLSMYKNLNLEYLEWLDLDKCVEEESVKATLRNIIQNIHYHLES